MDSKDIECQTLSYKKLIEDHETEKRKRAENEDRKRDLKQLFLDSAELKDMLASEPEGGVKKAVLAKWKELGPLTVEFILNNSSIGDLELYAKDLEYKRVDDQFGFYTVGFFKKGTNTRYGICRQVTASGFIFEGMCKNDIWTKYHRHMKFQGNVSENK